MTLRHGEIWWVRLDPTLGAEIKKTRPCLVVGANVLNERRRTVVIIPLSSAPQAAPPLLVLVVCGGRRAVAVVDQIRAVTRERFTRRIGEIAPQDLASVEDALRLVLEL
jgi:mRNA interferase MazF